MKKLGIVLGAAALFLIASAAAVYLNRGDARPRRRPQTLPPFALMDLQGRSVTNLQLFGKPAVLDFWASWCGPCRASTPALVDLYRAYSPKGVAFYGINLDEGPDDVEAFARSHGIPYPQLVSGDSTFLSDLRIQGIPTFIFVDARGRIARRFSGFDDEMPSEWASTLDQLITR